MKGAGMKEHLYTYRKIWFCKAGKQEAVKVTHINIFQ